MSSSIVQPLSPQPHYPQQYPETYNLDSPIPSPDLQPPPHHLASPAQSFRPRTTSPRPPHLENNSASSSISFLQQHSPRERISPTRPSGFGDTTHSGSGSGSGSGSNSPQLQNGIQYGQSSPTEWTPSPTPSEYSPSPLHPHLAPSHQPLYSPAADGKKEPSIKPPLHLNAYTYDDTSNPYAPRNRAPYEASPSPTAGAPDYPLSGASARRAVTREREISGGRIEGGSLQARWNGFYDSAGYWLGMYFLFNLGLTLFNKVVLVGFPFPYTLTGLHALSGCAGCYIALERGAFVPARLTQRENLILAAFSVLYTINIAVSNISLQLVTIPFHQVVRASTPLFTILISTVVLRTRITSNKLVSLFPVIAGVGFATYGDYYFTAWGLILTLLGTFLAAMKTVTTNLIQTGGGGRLKLHPLDLLMRMSPLAFIQCVAYGWYTGELERVRRYGATQMTSNKAIALLFNGIIACGLNIVSFTANKKAGALTMTVSANCKQVLTIALAVVLFDLHINFMNGVGILLTLVGGCWYGWVEYSEKRNKAAKAERG